MRCEIKDTQVYYEIIGEGTPIVLIHGWTLNHLTIKYTIEPIIANQPGWKRIYLDLPGHGKTPGTRSIQSQDHILEVVLEFIDKIVGEERFLIGGVSLGAYLARGVLYHKQSQVDGMLSIVPLIVPADAERDLPSQSVIFQDPELISGLSEEETGYLSLAVVHNQTILDRIKKGVEIFEDHGDEEFRTHIRQNPDRYALSVDVDQLAEPFMGPSLIVAGRQDFVAGYRDAWKILENFPRSTFAVLDCAGHLLEFEQEELLHTLVSDWLGRVEEFIKR